LFACDHLSSRGLRDAMAVVSSWLVEGLALGPVWVDSWVRSSFQACASTVREPHGRSNVRRLEEGVFFVGGLGEEIAMEGNDGRRGL